MQVASKELHMCERGPHSTFSYKVQYKVKGKNVTAARVEKSKHNPTSLRI